MIDSDGRSTVRIYECPSPDNCDFAAGGAAELLEHVNTEHSGEYQQEDWPATNVAQEERHLDEDDSDESPDE
ncbi:hypothetical protein HYG81_15090 [Natrinema zhouii]|uniref:Uncharacterized protein n=1 Tax=Natrinema zhouii TaxID=1710539 RepID=A0A7D6CMW2_9EURY|nr:hypothetical protein [Natrinema zhouii]QLK25398.1 hypothetical protein HYG81_15090 [Natrinema zhouii]